MLYLSTPIEYVVLGLLILKFSDTTGNTMVEEELCKLYPLSALSAEPPIIDPPDGILVMGVFWRAEIVNGTYVEHQIYPGDVLSADNFTTETHIDIVCASNQPVKWVSNYINTKAKQQGMLHETSYRVEEIYFTYEKLNLLRFMDEREIFICQSIGNPCYEIVFESSRPELPYQWILMDPASILSPTVQEFRNNLYEADKRQKAIEQKGNCSIQLSICYDPEDTKFSMEFIIDGSQMDLDDLQLSFVFHLTGQALENYFRFTPVITSSCIQVNCSRDDSDALTFYWRDFGYKMFSVPVSIGEDSSLTRYEPIILGKFTTDLFYKDVYYPGKLPKLEDIAGLRNYPTKVYKGLSLVYHCYSSAAHFSYGALGLVAEAHNNSHVGTRVEIKLHPHPITISGVYLDVGFFAVPRNVSYSYLLISCRFPFWDGPGWYTPEELVFVEVLDSEEPAILVPHDMMNTSGNETETIHYLAKSGEDFILNCIATGVPAPIVAIVSEASDLNLTGTCEVLNNSIVSCELIFSPFTPILAGYYKCIAHNDLGTASLLYQIQLEKEVGKSTTLFVFYVAFGTGLIILTITVVIYFWRLIQTRITFKKVNKHILEKFESGLISEVANELPINVKKFEMPLESWKIGGETLGTGSFGEVKIGTVLLPTIGNCPQERTIACKMIQPNSKEIAKFENLLHELTILSYLDPHPHIVSLIACHTSSIMKRKVFIGLEYCCNKDLLTFLRNDKNKNQSTDTPNNSGINSCQMYNWAIHICDGLIHLKSKNIVHSDISARNILLDENKVAKIADFGLARKMIDPEDDTARETGASTSNDLPFRWLALETLKYKQVSCASDIWSYGVTLWEIFTSGEQPWPDYEWNDDFLNQLENGVRLAKPVNAPEAIYQRVMMQCWQIVPEERICLEDAKKLFLNLIRSAGKEELDNYAYI